MASIKKGVCPSCGRESELAVFQFGVIHSTMCCFCVYNYLKKFVLPKLQEASEDCKSSIMSESVNSGNEK